MSRLMTSIAIILVLLLGGATSASAFTPIESQAISASALQNKTKGSSSAEVKPRFLKKFNAPQITRLAVSNLRKYVKANSADKPFKLVFQDTIPQSERKWMTTIAQSTIRALPIKSGETPLIIIGSTDSFVNENLTANGKSGYSSDWCGRPTTFEAYCAGAGWAGMNYKYSIESGRPISDLGKRAVVAHELFHVWHKGTDGSPGNNNVDPRQPNGFPLWFAEGNANFFGFAMAQISLKDSYLSGRSSQVDMYMQSSSRPLKEHVFWDSNPYGIGQAAAEYLVASVGMKKVMDVYSKVGSGQTFAAAFQESIGISVEDFYTLFESVRKNFTKYW